ncbi:DUF3102 domain-containing protein [Rhizobiaceae bacterium LC148]|nr:hypothetical protein YH62_11985 [Rhizobium sp. LC145]TKT45707.1 DUF3102 domain-containing protein [Rhizobiaceae bacterium LC148]
MSEIEVEGVGTMRPVNDWQMMRIKHMANRGNRHIAFVAFGLGMTIRQFKSLTLEKQRAAWDAHNRLNSPQAVIVSEPAHPRPPRPYQRVPVDMMAEYGRRLLQVKRELPHGHFRQWIENKSGFTYSQAQRFMRAATAETSFQLRHQVVRHRK